MTSAHHLATIAQPCDAVYWAHHISTLKLPRTPTGALNLNVDGRHVLGPLQGFGQLWKKTFRIQLKGWKLTAREVIKTWKEHFSKFWPSWDHFYAPSTGIVPGEVVLINMVIPGDLPIGLPISTGVVVLCADEQSFTFMTPQGHMFAGWITFSAYEENGAVFAQIQVFLRASDPLYELGFRLGANKSENIFWIEREIYDMKRLYRIIFVILGGLSFILTAGLCLQMPLVTGILPQTGSFPIHIFLASITASIAASLLWIGFSGELGAAAGGAIDLAVFYAGLTIFQLLSPRNGSQSLLAGALLCLAGVIVSLGILLWFRRYPIEDERPMPLPVRVSFGGFAVVLILVGSAVLLQVPNVFAWTLNPLSSALVGCFFLGSACYFLYGLMFPRWQNACGQLWSFLAYDIVLIVPLLFHFATVSSAQLPSLIVNTIILVYSAALALYYLLIKKQTRFRLTIARLSSQAKPLEWSR